MFTALILDTLFNAHAHASAVRGKYFLVIVHSENKSDRILTLQSKFEFVENFPCRKLPAIRYVVNTVNLNEQVAYKRGVAWPKKWRPVLIIVKMAV